MKKYLTLLAVILFIAEPCFSFGSVVATASDTETTSQSGKSKVQTAIAATETQTSAQPTEKSATDFSEELIKESDSLKTDSTETIVEEVTVSFVTSADHPFSNGETVVKIKKEKGDSLTAADFPKWQKETEQFKGWSFEKRVLSSQKLESMILAKDVTFTADFTVLMNRSVPVVMSYNDQSIKDIITNTTKTNLILIPSPKNDGADYAEYSSNETGIREVLFDLYQNGNSQEFVLYVGTNLTLPAGTNGVTNKIIAENITADTVTFYALKDRVSRLIITGNAEDPITSSTSLTPGSHTVTLGSNIHFGTDIVFRNINYTGTTMYMNGHDLSLNGGATGNGFNIYGGTDTGDIEGSPTILVNGTGSGTWRFYGGSQNGGTLKGNPTIHIQNTVGGINTIAGGANIGKIDGNTNVNITKLNGTLANFYGGGVGTNTSNKANVTGNITSTIQTENESFRLGTFYGGVQYGDVNGEINTTISGNGGFNSGSVRFIGGSREGNIGSDSVKAAITTNLDSSLYSTGAATFEGGNRNSGIIRGHITNKVRAGISASAGGINDFNGGGGNDISKLSQSNIGASSITTYDQYTSEQRRALAESAASFKVYGNITSYLMGGSFANGANYYTTAAGRGGYIEGNTTIEVGSLNEDRSLGGSGLVYRGSKPTDLTYTSSNHTRGYVTAWDIVGGGGTPGTAWDIYIKGNTNTVMNNVIARWTYGGSYSGVIEGNSCNTLNAGIVDTLEGTGYTGRRVYGNGYSVVNNGQIDWFLSGGGWDDEKIIGDVSVTVYDGVINASMGASYGVAASHTVTGNSDNRIYGGNFSGQPRTGPSAFSGGITNNGSLLGNANLTIDLRAYEGVFSLPSGTYISGGNPYNSTNTVGTDSSNIITLNIYTRPGSDVLNGATIYGDGGRTASNTRSGKINMNIQATGSKIGNLYTTYYSNISSNHILRDVVMNVQGAKSINGISGGNASDNFNNTIFANSTNRVNISFGENVDSLGQFQSEPIDITGLGIVNFTSLNVTNGIKVMANGGHIKNGQSATAANHSSAYNAFGDITLSKGSGIGISTTANLISGAKLTVRDKSYIESSPGTGKINFSDIEIPDPNKDQLVWLKNTTNDEALRVTNQGTWFGSTQGYQVLTINPTVSNAVKITPVNFTGIETATGKTFIGDNDITNSSSGYGIAIPGSIIDYEVENPGIVNGEGGITHNVAAIKAGNSPLNLQAWGTETAGTKTQKGRLMIPAGNNISPTLTFTPETTVTGSWIYSGNVQSTKVGETATNFSEQKTSAPVDWTSVDGEYSYTIKVAYSNKSEFQGHSAIVTEEEASKLTKETALEMLEATGRPFFSSTLTDALLAKMKEPLGDAVYRKHQVILNVGDAANNQQTKYVNLMIVKNESQIAADRSIAIYAKDIHLTLDEANALTGVADLNKFTQPVTIFADDTTNDTPEIAEAQWRNIQQTTASELLKNTSATYSCTLKETISKTVNVTISGELKFAEVPETIDFGTQKIATTTQTYWPTLTNDLKITDTRGSEGSPWKVTVKETQPLTNGTNTIEEGLVFVSNGQEQIISQQEVTLKNMSVAENGSFVLNENWKEASKEGIKLVVPVEKQVTGTYSGKLSWSLVSAP